MTKLDPSRTLDSIKAFSDQLRQSWESVSAVSCPACRPDSIIICGMGGSGLAGKVVKSLFYAKINVPIEVVNDYQLPNYVNQKSLVILMSYSGNTEETLSCYRQAKAKNAHLFSISTGGELATLIHQGEAGVILKPIANFLGYPKTALGYMLGALLSFLSQAKLIALTREEFLTVIDDWPAAGLDHSGQKIAQFLQGKIGVIVASEHLIGAAVSFRNQINELAHCYSLIFDLPEMNHHQIEALQQPQDIANKFVYLFIESADYFSRNAKRYLVLKEILGKMSLKFEDYRVVSQSKLGQALEVVNLGGLTAAYLSFLNNQDPGPEPWILLFKEKLS